MAATAALLAGCLAACAGPAGESTAAAVENSGVTAAQQSRIERAEALLIQKCMTKHGFRYWPAPLTGAEESRSSRFVLDDIAWARAHGYGGRTEHRLLAQRRQNPNRTYVESLAVAKRAAYSAALNGDPSRGGVLTADLPGGGTLTTPRGGCRATAQQELYGDRETWFRVSGVAMNLTPLWVPSLVKDARFTKALEAWSVCMRRKGYSYADPREIRTNLSGLTKGLSQAQTHATEVELAVAEATCARGSALADTARALKRTYLGRVSARYGKELALYRQLQRAALKRAEEITGRRR
ncbi:hypothetical protein ACGFWF_24195 [Streptomyces sp. NPDC048581]|uniref:hypothetical protein n=1 Tax=Streptomyces sp. NPDC048581 TaxID=3365572 RepID=UPI00371023FF